LAFLTYEAAAFGACLAFEALLLLLLLFFVISDAKISDIIILAQRDWIIQLLSSFKEHGGVAEQILWRGRDVHTVWTIHTVGWPACMYLRATDCPLHIK
jgi:hypothetical protein